jgi:hypothetical protein
VLGNAKHAFESMLGLDKEQQQGLLAVMDAAGLSNHPLMIRALYNLHERYREPQPVSPNQPSQPQGRGGPRGWYDKVDGP